MIANPNRDRRSERHEATRREILDAAWAAAHESSIAGLTLRDIAARVGMQQPSLYSHCASKQAIYDAMFRQAWKSSSMTLGATSAACPPSLAPG